MNDQKILDKILDYLAKKITNFKVRTSGKCTYFTCPSCRIEGFTATIIPNTEKVRCVACNIVIDGFDNVVKTVEPDLCSYEKTEIVAHLRDVLDLPINTEDETKKALDFYEKNGFNLIPIAKNQKNPIECFDKETEILTEKGFKYFKDLKKEDKVAQRNKEGLLEFVTPLNIINYKYEGIMYFVEHKNLSLCITPNHIIHYHSSHNKEQSDTIENFYNRIKNFENKFYIPSILNYKDCDDINYFYLPKVENKFNRHIEKIDMNLWLEFLGYFLSEGWTTGSKQYKICIAQKNSWKKDIIRKCLKKLPYNFCELEDRFTTNNKQLYTYLKQFGKAHDKFIPRELLSLSRKQTKILLDALMLGDGHIPANCYSTCSKNLKEGVYELFLRLNYVVNSYTAKVMSKGRYYKDHFIKSNDSQYLIRGQKYKSRTIRKRHIKKINYNDNVYCVEVPSNVIFVRRKGRSFWSGNCAWTTKTHKNRKEWEDWLKDGLNIGLKTGKCSNVTIIDIDQEEIPPGIDNLLLPTLTFKTNKGWHLVFKYTEELKNTRYDEYKTDLLNDGKQSVVFPSVVDGKIREIRYNEIAEMPKELIALLKSKTSVPLQTFSERMIEEIKLGSVNLEDLNLRQVSEGNRNSFLIRFGGILRKEMNLAQTAYTLDLINKHFCNPPLSAREFDAIVNSLDKYISMDGTELAVKVLNYLRIVEEANSMDIREAIGEKTSEGKQRMEKAIAYLIKEGLVYKKRKAFHLIKKAEWRETFLDEGSTIDFNMPYLNDVATFRNGDMIVIGAKSKVGKSHISLNIIKQLIDQGKKPHYISLESGNRFVSIAKTLGISEGQFKWCVHFSPENIEIEKNAITIIDWVLPTDYAETDKLFKHFAEQLVKQGGILICFVQLKQDGTFFAQNMISFFPALVTRYMYDDEKGDGTYGGFHIDYIREPKIRQKFMKVPCKYNWEKKTLEKLENAIDED